MTRQITRLQFVTAIENAIAASPSLPDDARSLLRAGAQTAKRCGVGSWMTCPLARAGLLECRGALHFAWSFDAQFRDCEFLEIV